MSQTANPYAQALYLLAKEEGLEETIYKQLEVLSQAFEREPDFLRLLASPNLPKQERCAIIDESFRDKVHIYLLNFLKILTQRNYIRIFTQCVKAYRAQYNADHGILTVKAVTALALTQEQSAKLSQKLETLTGKTIFLENEVDPAVMGGVRLDYDGMQVDGTVQNRLDTISELLKNTQL